MVPLIKVIDLKKYHPLRQSFLFSKTRGVVRAVDRISFAINEGETLGLVGESGCGKLSGGSGI